MSNHITTIIEVNESGFDDNLRNFIINDKNEMGID
jgi:hypothetical protein